MRRVSPLPIAVGFGISLPGQVSILGGLADAAVVGSALVQEIDQASSVDAEREALGTRVRLLRGRRGGRLVIHFFSDEELQGLYEAIVRE